MTLMYDFSVSVSSMFITSSFIMQAVYFMGVFLSVCSASMSVSCLDVSVVPGCWFSSWMCIEFKITSGIVLVKLITNGDCVYYKHSHIPIPHYLYVTPTDP